MGNIKQINIKNRTYYFFDDMINVKNFDPNLLKIDQKSYKNIDIYCNGYITMKDSEYVKSNSLNPLYLIINEVDGYIKKENWNKYLTLVSTDKSKEVLTKYTELLGGIKNISGESGKDFTKIKFNSDDSLPLNKTLKLHNMTIIVRSVFEKDAKYYPQDFFRWMFIWVLKMLQYGGIDVSERIDINKTSASKEYMLCHYWYFKDVGNKYQPYICTGCHAVSVMAY